MPNELLTTAIEKLAGGDDLGEEQAASVLEEIMSGRAGEVQTAAFLVALRAKGETAGEITGLARTMRRFSLEVEVEGGGLVDTCGTGGDKSGTFNVSTTSAFVVAGAGGRVAKHGNRSATSACGSADVLEALGAKIDLDAAAVARCIEETGIGFMFAPVHHQAMKYVVPVRRELGIRTIFNFLGPLTNPAGAEFQLVGISERAYLEVLARALGELGCRRALVVHGSDGLDEITVGGVTYAAELNGGEVELYEIDPQQYGIGPAPAAELAGGDAAENARIVESVLAGEAGPRRDIVLLNAGAALFVAGLADDIGAGIEAARRSIDSGDAAARLEAFVACTRSR